MKHFLLLTLLMLITSCAPIYVNYDYESSTDFNNYKTYNMIPEMQTGLSELDTNRLLDAVDQVLQSKGYQVSETPDFFVNITSNEFQSNNANTVGVGVGGGGRNIGGGINVGIPIGNANINREITFDFIDAKKNALFWQAISDSSFNPNSTPEKREEKLKSIAIKVFSKYPPEK